jgi:AAA domain
VDKRRAAGQHLDKLFGTATGYVAAAYKDKGQSWQECQFSWPKDRAKIIGWAEVHQDANIFVCPALRTDPHTRKKGDGAALKWLWADVDWQGVPPDRVQDVKDRIAELGSYVVRSGSGDNVHVYVKLSREVDRTEFSKLNTGLRDYLYADNKQADNSLLRLPGTMNWKTESGTPVEVGEGSDKAFNPAVLMKRRAFRDAKVIADAEASEWSFIKGIELSSVLRRKVNMPTDEAEGRYGSRFKAVWAITGDLHKAGVGLDEIHSLMDKFPAALDKMAEENGYDVHRDVDKRLAFERASATLTEEETDEIEEQAFELAGDEDDAADYEARILKLALAELERSEARKKARAMEAQRSWIEPPATVSQSLTDALIHPPEPEPFLIAGIAPARGNVVLTAQFKAGKTDLVVGSLVRALCDGVPFLDHFQVFTPAGGMKCGHWNLEMDHGYLIDQYIRPSGYENTDNLVIASLRGYRVSLLSDIGRQWAIEWLRSNEIKVWTIDSIAQLARMCGISENSNEDMAQMFGAIDEIKTEAGVDACFLIAHTGRAEQEVGKERARAATVIDDWPDCRWVMTVDGSDIRYLQVQGRGEQISPTSLDYDGTTHRYSFAGRSRGTAASDGWVQEVVKIVTAHPDGVNESTLYTLLKERGSVGPKAKAIEYMIEAQDGGFIRREKVRPVGMTGGGRTPWMHFPTADRVEGDATRNATAREVDMTNVTVRKRRKPAV